MLSWRRNKKEKWELYYSTEIFSKPEISTCAHMCSPRLDPQQPNIDSKFKNFSIDLRLISSVRKY
jgi:hypothetical protein